MPKPNPTPERTRRMGRALGMAWAVCLAMSPVRAAFPGENGNIVFSYNAAPAPPQVSRENQLWWLDPQEAGLPKCRRLAEKVSASMPSFAPDHRLLLVSVFGLPGVPGGNCELALLNPGTGAVIRKSHTAMAPETPGSALFPAWSPHGDQVAFLAGIAGAPAEHNELRLLDLTGTRTVLHNLTMSKLAWSPDGTRLAFIRKYQLWILNLATGKASPLVPPGAGGGEPKRINPAWSPDGQFLACSRHDRGGNWRLGLWNLATLEERVLSDGAGHAVMQDWSPDGRMLLYVSDRGGKLDLYARDAVGGTEERRLTDLPAGLQFFSASWSARPPLAGAGAASTSSSSSSNSSNATNSSSSSASPGSSSSSSSAPNPATAQAMAIEALNSLRQTPSPRADASSPTPASIPAASPPDPANAQALAIAALAALRQTPGPRADASPPSPASTPAAPGGLFYWRTEQESDQPSSSGLWKVAALYGVSSELMFRDLAVPQPFADCLLPAVAPGGRLLAYARPSPAADGAAGPLAIMIVASDNGRREGLLTAHTGGLPANAIEPAWAPDGKRLAFLAAPGDPKALVAGWGTPPTGTCELQLQDAGGLRTLATAVDGVRPAWSPNGDRLAFFRDGKLWIHSFVTGQSAFRHLEPAKYRYLDPAWCPDGLRMALVDWDAGQGKSELATVRLKGGRKESVARFATRIRRPVWSPDGRQVVFGLFSYGAWRMEARPLLGVGRTRAVVDLAVQSGAIIPCAWLGQAQPGQAQPGQAQPGQAQPGQAQVAPSSSSSSSSSSSHPAPPRTPPLSPPAQQPHPEP